jgi:hypothetical protein
MQCAPPVCGSATLSNTVDRSHDESHLFSSLQKAQVGRRR